MKDSVKNLEGPNADQFLVKTYEEGLLRIRDKPGLFMYGIKYNAEIAAQSATLRGLNLYIYQPHSMSTNHILLTQYSPFTRIINKGDWHTNCLTFK